MRRRQELRGHGGTSVGLHLRRRPDARHRHRIDIDIDECVDYEPSCLVEVIYDDDLPEALRRYSDGNARFFTDTLPGQPPTLGWPGRADKIGASDVDTPFVATPPPQAQRGEH